MQQLDPKRIASRLTEYYGLPLVGGSGRNDAGHEYIEISPAGVHRNEGFTVRITLGWRSLHAEFFPGPYAAPMVEEMGRASAGSRHVFTGLAARTAEDKGVIKMQVNGADVDPSNTDSWPDHWERMSMMLDKSPLAVNTEDREETEASVMHWGGRFVAGIIALAPLEELETIEEVNPEGLPEGAIIRVEVNRYERNRFNRAACIEIHGNSCKACGFNFGRIYGALGEGFIHVHHVTPVSEIGPDYRIDPATDLVPLCPNCHAMVHLSKSPMSVQELKKSFQNTGSGDGR